MADRCLMCLLGLMILCPLLTGTNKVNDFCSSGENMRLPCNNALSDCTSTTWIYSRHSETVELVTLGKMKKDRERDERLSLGSDCSLNIKNVSGEDIGFYTCRQYVNGQPQGNDLCVFLHVLQVSSSSSQTEIRPGRSVTLSCQLQYYGVPCNDLVNHDEVQLSWVNQDGVNLKTDSRYQILFSSSLCNINLTTTLLNEDHNREWRCQLTQRNQLKTSVTYAFKYSDSTETTTMTPVNSKTTKTSVTPTKPAPIDSTAVSNSNPEKKTSQTPEAAPAHQVSSSLTVIVIVVAVAVLAVLSHAVILWVIFKRKADNRRGINDAVELKDGVTYTEVTTYSKIRTKNNNVHGHNNVTYCTIGEGKADPQDKCTQLYASVNKSHHK